MIKQYKGPLGNFQYDDREFKLENNRLYYIGTETDGSKIKIPEGIIDCSFMFMNSNIVTPPVIPAEVTNCYSMFWNCYSLVETPVIPASVTDCGCMFNGCGSLVQAPVVPSNATNCSYMFADCGLLKNYVIPSVHAVSTQNMYRHCPPIIQEMDKFIRLRPF